MKYSLANLGILPANAALQPGQVALANEAAFQQTFLSQPLTTYAIGYKSQDEKLEKLLEFLAPGVRTSRRFEYRVANDKAAFAAAENDIDIRSLMGEFAMVAAQGTIATGRTLSKGLSTVIDKDDLQENPNLKNEKVAWLKRMLMRAEIIRAFTLLNGAATNTAVNWSSAKDADSDVLAMIIAAGDAIGLDPNRVLFGNTAWQKRVQALGAADTAASRAGYGRTPETLADWLGIEEVHINRQRYQSGSGKAALTTANVVLAFNAEAEATTEDSSNIKRFWSPEEGGEWAVWEQDKASHLIMLTVSHKSNIVLTSSTGIRKLTVS